MFKNSNETLITPCTQLRHFVVNNSLLMKLLTYFNIDISVYLNANMHLIASFK